MKRLVYAPNVQAFVKTDTGVLDLSPYLVGGSINRRVNQVSSADLTFRNPAKNGKLLFTAMPDDPSGKGAVMHPMDPIIIMMQRMPGRPVQVFTGYLDKSPYIQLFPGLASLTASCTLKRLLYTQWDAALPFVKNFVQSYNGWVFTDENGIANPTAERKTLQANAAKNQSAFNDGSIGGLLYGVLTEIGGWDTSNIVIEMLPASIHQIVVNLYDQISKEAQQGTERFKDLLQMILGSQPQGTGSPAASTGTTTSGAVGTVNALFKPGTAWRVKASAESNDSTNGGPGCDGSVPPNLIGYSELSKDLGTDFSALGNIPCRTDMIIGNPKTGQATIQKKQDNGSGSPGFLPVMGIYPHTRQLIGLDNSGGYDVIIQRADGGPLNPVRGTSFQVPASSGHQLTGGSSTQGKPSTKASGNHSQPGHIVHGLFTAAATGSSSPAQSTPLATTFTHAAFQSNVTPNVAKAAKSPGGKTGNPSQGSSSSSGSINIANMFPDGVSPERIDEGVDYAGQGKKICAIADCDIVAWRPGAYSGDLMLLRFKDPPLSQAGCDPGLWYVSELFTPTKTSGSFKAGDVIGTIGGSTGIETGWWSNSLGNSCGAPQVPNHNSGGPVISAWGKDFSNLIVASGGQPGTVTGPDPNPVGGTPINDWAKVLAGKANFVGPGAGTSGSTSGSSSGGGGNGLADAFSTFINLPSIFDSIEAVAFTGKRSFMADQPLFPFVEQLTQASMRNFMSMPNGNFFAFFPDYFGLFGRKYYWEIHDIEIIDGRIDLSDDPLVTNVGVAGDVTQYHNTVDVFDLIMTSGIFDIFDAFATGYIDGPDSLVNVNNAVPPNSKASKSVATASKSQAIAFLRRYGARPYVEEVPAIRSPFFEMFYAFQKFMLLWSKQFQTTFELTFMPEIFPGGLIALPEHNLQLYVEEVQHAFDYQQGFTTTISVSSPSAVTGSGTVLRRGLAHPILDAAAKNTNPNGTPRHGGAFN